MIQSLKKYLKNIKAYRTIKQSGLFDEAYYLKTYPDVRQVDIDPVRHYLAHGAAEARNPSPYFDTSYYLTHNLDVNTDTINPLVHYISCGEKEGRRPSPEFDPAWYLEFYADVREARQSPLKHYMQHGAEEARFCNQRQHDYETAYSSIKQSGLFDEEYYLKTYPDVRQANIDPVRHYLAHGAAEGRSPSPYFDTSYYLANNTDIKPRIVNPLLHYIVFGEREGRRPSLVFDPVMYLELYADVRDAGASPLLHYMLHGRHENRLDKMGTLSTKGISSIAGHVPTKQSGQSYNILLVAHAAGKALFGGERSFMDTLEALSASRYSVTVVLPSGSSHRYIEAVCNYSVKVVTFDYACWSRQTSMPDSEVVKLFGTIVEQEGIDLVYVNTIMLREPLIAASLLGVASVLHARELIMHDNALSSFIGKSPEEIVANVVSLSDFIIANSKKTAESFQKKNGKNSTYTVYNMVDSAHFDMPNNFSEHKINIGLISSNLPKKGIFDFVEIARLLENRLCSASFRLIGPINSEIIELIEMQKEGSLPRNIKFDGYIEDPSIAVRSVNIVLNLSHFQESFGRTVLEAMAAGRPVIAYNWGALPELIQEGVNGYLVGFRDYEAVADKIEHLCTNQNMIVTLGEAGKALARLYYDREVYTDKIRSVVEDIIFRKTHNLPELQKSPTISVVVPNYNYEKYITERLLSILNQTVAPLEIIFLDDNSTDKSLEIAESVLQNQNRIPFKVIQNKKNMGVYRQWQRGFLEARGDYVWIAEADDCCHPMFLEIMSYKIRYENVAIAYAQSKKISGDGTLLEGDNLAHTNGINLSKWRHDYAELGLREMVDALFYRNTIPNVSACLIKRSSLLDVGDELLNFRYCGDWFLYASILRQGRIAYVSTPINFFRRHENSVTRTKSKEKDYLNELLAVRKYIVKNFPVRQQQVETMLEFLDKDFKFDGIRVNSASDAVHHFLSETNQILSGRRRVAFITTNNGSYNGGSEVLWKSTASQMRKLGHDVVVLIKHWKPEPDFFYDFENNGIKILFKEHQGFEQVVRLCPDLVVISTGDQDEGTEYFPLLKKNKISYVILNQLTKPRELWPIKANLLQPVREGYKSAAKVFFTCHNNRHIMEDRLGESIQNYDIHFNPYHMDRDIAIPYPSMESGLSIAVPARLLTIHKGQDMIIEIMRKPKWRKANITINLYGEGPDEDSLQKTIDNYGVTNVRMNGKVKNMVDIWRKNHAILLASRMEGLPIVLVGAMICARTPILTNVGGHAEVVDDNINGFIANDCSVLSLEDALERAYSKRHELEKMGLLARQKALDYLPDDTTQHFIDKIIKVMETL